MIKGWLGLALSDEERRFESRLRETLNENAEGRLWFDQLGLSFPPEAP
jgi:hypothetical protein